MIDAAGWALDNLTIPERAYLRRATGQPPPPAGLEPWALDCKARDFAIPALLPPHWRSAASRDLLQRAD